MKILKSHFCDGEFVFTPNLKSLECFKKVRAKELFLELVSHFQPFINKPIKRIVIRNSKTRWGSCNHKKGYINLSLRLIEKPLSADALRRSSRTNTHALSTSSKKFLRFYRKNHA